MMAATSSSNRMATSWSTGAFAGTVDFDQGAGVAQLTSRGGTDAYVARYSGDGLFKTVTQLGGLENDAGSALTRTATGECDRRRTAGPRPSAAAPRHCC